MYVFPYLMYVRTYVTCVRKYIYHRPMAVGKSLPRPSSTKMGRLPAK